VDAITVLQPTESSVYKKTTLLPYNSVEGLTNSHDIAGKFADMFEAVGQPNIISVNAYHESTFNGRF